MSNANAAGIPWTEVLLGSQTAERFSVMVGSLRRLLRGAPEPGPGPEQADEDWRSIQAQRPWRLLAAVTAGVMTVLTAGWVLSSRLPARQSDLDAQVVKAPHVPQPFRPMYEVNPQALASVDMARVHRELLPAWMIAMQHDPYSVGEYEARRTFSRLRSEAGKDPNLAQLLDALHEMMLDDVAGYAADIHLLLVGWNEYLERHGQPWRIEHHFERTPRGPRLYIRSYQVLSDIRIASEGDTQRVLLLARADETNLMESFFGQTSLEMQGAIVVADRVADYAIGQLWPVFGEQPENLTPLQRAFASSIRAEAEAALPPAALQELSHGMKLHDRLTGAVHALGQRRGCGRTVVVGDVPWTGLGPRALTMIRNAAERNARKNCKRLTLSDAEFLETASRQLGGDAELELALGQLSAWLARAVTIHEARHVADDRQAPAGERTAACGGCPPAMTPNERAELRAYLAAFGTEGLGYVSLMQACGTGGHGAGPSSAAVSYAMSRLMPAGCEVAPPRDLYARARALEAELFGASEPMELPAGFPLSLPVPR